MTQAIFKFSDSTQTIDTFTVDLIDNPGVRAWAYAVLLNKKQRNISLRSISYLQSNHNSSFVTEQYQKMVDYVSQLAPTQFKFNERMPSVDQIDQQFLNRLHRHFTQCCLDMWCYDFYDLTLQAHLNPILQELNNTIHQIEGYYETSQKKHWDRQGKELTIRADGDQISFDITPFRYCHSYDPADVILDAHILGKTLIESFMCNDNPDNWDTSGHARTSGGATIMLTDCRQQIYNSPEFNQWLSDHGVDRSKVLADFPIGNFVQGDKDRLIKRALDLQFKNLLCEIGITL